MFKDHNAVTPVRLEPAALRSRVKHSTTEPLRSQDRKVSFICYKMTFSVFLFAVVYSAVVFLLFFVLYLFSNFITVLGLFKFYPLSAAKSSSYINDCVTCLYQFPDPAKVSDPAEDYILSLHQLFSFHQTACVSKLHLKEIFAKTTLAASVTNAVFELCSGVIKGRQNLLQGVHAVDGPPYNTLVKVIQLHFRRR